MKYGKIQKKKKERESTLVLEMVRVSLNTLGMNGSEQLGLFNGGGRTQKTSESGGWGGFGQ